MKFTTCLIALCIILGAAVLTEANNQYTTAKATTVKYTTTRTRRTRKTTTMAPATYTRATTQAPATYTTTRRTTTMAPATYTTTRRTTTKAPATYTRATTQAPATYTTTRRTTTTTRRTTTTTTRRTTTTTKAPATYTTRRQTTTTYQKPTTHAYTTRRQTTAAYTTKHTTTKYDTPATYSTETTTQTTTETTTQTTTDPNALTEVDYAILNFALNLEYLEAEFYCAAIGRTPSYAGDVGGTVTGGEAVNFTTPEFRQYAEEIATDEENHVVFLRSVLGDRAVDRPDINIAGGINGSFGQAARAAGALAGVSDAAQEALATFSPYTNELYFLHGAFIFEDVGVTAYKGAISSINSKSALSSAAGILAVEGYHAGQVRTLLYGVRRTVAIAANAVNGSEPLRVRDIIGAISGLRASLDGSGNGGHDQSIVSDDENGSGSGSGSGNGEDDVANVVPADDDSIAFGRTAREVLNIVYGAQGGTMGLFFPNGVNGDFSALLQ